MTTELKSPLEMTDEELLAFDWSSLPDEPVDLPEKTEEPEDTETDQKDEKDAGKTVEDTTEAGTEESKEEKEDTAVAETTVEKTPEETPSSDDVKEPVDVPEEKPGVDYRVEYEKLLKPFKASGREMKVDNVDEAISLMQMGVDYSKKMSALKPNLRLLKTLEKNGLLDEARLNYLIDLSKKNPEAIKTLIKESDFNLDTYDPEKPVNYVPNTYTTTDQEVELDQVLDSIRHTDSYAKTLQVVGNMWDEKSRTFLVSQNPSAIKLLNDQIASGVFDQVMSVVEKERMLGKLNGVSDLDAYDMIGNRLFGQKQNPPSTGVTPKAQAPSKPKPSDSELAQKKKSLAPPKGATPKNTTPDYNPLAMSDEEFAKLVLPD